MGVITKKKNRKAVGIVEASILIAVVSSALVAVRGYLEKSIKASTKDYTDVILGVQEGNKEQETAGQEEYYEQNPVVSTQTRAAEGVVYSEAATREYAATTSSTPIQTKINNTSRFYLDIVPARRGVVQTVRIGEITDDAYEMLLFNPSGRQ